jgi:hypothetical protein
MKKITAALPLIALLLVPLAASAHEHQTFEINGIAYEFSVGSANEPIYVGDKSGLQLRITKAGVVAGHEEHHEDHATEGAVEGLEKTLKVEMIAGTAKKTFDLKPTWGAPGAYDTVFYPTAAGEFSYRVFGTIDEIPVDLFFTCRPSHDMEGAETDTSRVEISPGVVRVEKRGAFGCPLDKSAVGFPGTPAGTESGLPLAVAVGSGAIALAALAIAVRRRA